MKESKAGCRYKAKCHRQPTASRHDGRGLDSDRGVANALVDLPGPGRHTLLLDGCARDSDLKRVLERLLDVHDQDARYAQRIVYRTFARAPRYLRTDGRP